VKDNGTRNCHLGRRKKEGESSSRKKKNDWHNQFSRGRGVKCWKVSGLPTSTNLPNSKVLNNEWGLRERGALLGSVQGFRSPAARLSLKKKLEMREFYKEEGNSLPSERSKGVGGEETKGRHHVEEGSSTDRETDQENEPAPERISRKK